MEAIKESQFQTNRKRKERSLIGSSMVQIFMNVGGQ
jgi:hypothetical protein